MLLAGFQEVMDNPSRPYPCRKEKKEGYQKREEIRTRERYIYRSSERIKKEGPLDNVS